MDDREVRGAQLAKYPVVEAARNDIAGPGRAAPTKRTTAAEVDPPLYFMSHVYRVSVNTQARSSLPALQLHQHQHPAPAAPKAPTLSEKRGGIDEKCETDVVLRRHDLVFWICVFRRRPLASRARFFAFSISTPRVSPATRSLERLLSPLEEIVGHKACALWRSHASHREPGRRR